MTFDEWWAEYPINKSDLQISLKLAFAEVAEKAWNAAVNVMVDQEKKGSDGQCKECGTKLKGLCPSCRYVDAQRP